MEEFYEELPGDQIQEDLYEDLPESAYSQQTPSYPNGGFNQGFQQQMNSSGAPPPLPTSNIPQFRPGGGPVSPPPQTSAPPPPPPTSAPPPSSAPPLPTRSATTQLTSKAPPPGKKGGSSKDAKRKPAPSKPAKSEPAGISMDEIIKKAKSRQPIGDLERKNKDTSEDGKHVAPWANQLRKTPKHEPRPLSPEEKEQNEEVPEFVKKARTLSIVEADDGDEQPQQRTSPSPAVGRKPAPGPPPGVKPRVPAPASMLPKSVEQDSGQEKPPWLKQREKQVALAQQGNETPTQTEEKVRTSPKPVRPAPVKPRVSSNKPSPPIHPKLNIGDKPNVMSKPSPSLPSKAAPPPPTAGEENQASAQAPQVAKKPKPVPTPRNVTSPEKKASPPAPTFSSSIRERALTLQQQMAGGESPDKEPTPPPPAAAPAPTPPPVGKVPPPKPARNTPINEVSESPPPPPLTQPPPSTKAVPPHLPTRNSSSAPPPPETPPPPSGSKLPPPLPVSSPPSADQAPPLPVRPPAGKPMAKLPPPLPSTPSQPTPPTGSVMKFRRLPMRPVDLANPPPLPSRDLKRKGSLPAEPIPELLPEDDEELYEDTVLPPSVSGGEPIEEELYDDVTVSAPPISRPPPASSYNKPPAEAPPAIPALPPPNKQRQDSGSDVSPVNGAQTSEIIPEEDEEFYEDLATFPPSGSPVPPSPSSSSLQPPSAMSSSSTLAPPSPQHAGSGSTLTASPSFSRKKLTKDEKKKQKEQEKLEKEQKKKNELKMKNRVKGLKAHKQFNLPTDVKHLFAVEVVLDHPKPTKDHVACNAGDVLFVLLIAHEKMSAEKYLIEKEDGTIGFVKKSITQRTNYTDPQSVLSQSVPPTPDAAGGGAYPEPEDIYESLPQEDEPLPSSGAPPLPSQAIPTLPPGNSAPPRFPAPNAPPPPPPQDGPEEMYEYLPEEN